MARSSSPEPVPFAVFERMAQGYELQIEQLNLANAKLLDTIERLTTPQAVTVVDDGARKWFREEEEDAQYGEATGTLSKEEADLLRRHAEFDTPTRDQFK